MQSIVNNHIIHLSFSISLLKILIMTRFSLKNIVYLKLKIRFSPCRPYDRYGDYFVCKLLSMQSKISSKKFVRLKKRH